MIGKRFPPADMELLDRYEVARRDTCIRCVSEDRRVIQFVFREEDAPLVPSRSCSTRNIAVGKKCMDAIENWQARQLERNRTIRELQRHCETLIHTARHAEDIIEVWPAAKHVLNAWAERRDRSLTAVSPEIRDFITQDNAGANAAEAKTDA